MDGYVCCLSSTSIMPPWTLSFWDVFLDYISEKKNPFSLQWFCVVNQQNGLQTFWQWTFKNWNWNHLDIKSSSRQGLHVDVILFFWHPSPLQRLSRLYVRENGQLQRKTETQSFPIGFFSMSQIMDFPHVPVRIHQMWIQRLRKDSVICTLPRKVLLRPQSKTKSPTQWSVPPRWLIYTLKSSPTHTPLPSLIGLARYSARCGAVGP